MHVVTADAIAAARNLMLVVERCHLNVEAMAASPYVAGLSVLTDDEADLGAAVSRWAPAPPRSRPIPAAASCMPAALRSAATRHHGSCARPRRMHCGCRANQDVIRHRADRRVGRARHDVGADRSATTSAMRRRSCRAPRSRTSSGRAPRRFLKWSGTGSRIPPLRQSRGRGCPERRRLASSPASRTRNPDSQPAGADRPPARHRPAARRPRAPAFAVATGLLVYPQYAHLEHVEPRHTRQLRTGTDGYFGKVGRWLRESF
jgi:cell division protein FtsA